MTRPTLETLRPRGYWRVVPSELYSLIGLGAPALGFGAALIWAASRYERFAWILTPSQYPWQIWVLIFSGTLATAGGLGDWIFHRRYVTVGPKEHHSHLLALLTGGLPVFILMLIASALRDPSPLLLPIIAWVLYTAALICYDEFVFHRRRCTPIETLFHRLLVFGNGAAWMAWMHWCFVYKGGAYVAA